MNIFSKYSDVVEDDSLSPQYITKSINTKRDALVLSTALFHAYSDKLNDRFDIQLSKAHDFVSPTANDCQVASDIKNHFSKQIMISALNNEKISGWQRAVIDFLEGDRMSYTDNTIGMIYRLPEYYYTDLAISRMDNEHFANCSTNLASLKIGTTLELIPIQAFQRNLAGLGKKKEYWFKDETSNSPVMLSVQSTNELTYLWDHFFSSGKPLLISGNFRTKKHSRGLDYYHAEKWKLENIK